MYNEKIIAGLKEVVKGINVLISELSVQENKEVTKEVAKEVDKAPEEVVAKEVETGGRFTEEELSKIKYNDLKKLSSELGVKATGTRAEIIERLLALGVEDEDTPEEVEEVEEEKVKVEEEVVNRHLETAQAIAQEMTVKEIKEVLREVGKGVTGTKAELTETLAEALEEGLLEVEGGEESEPVEEVVAEEVNEPEEEGEIGLTSESYFPEFDEDGYNDPENMTEERSKAVLLKMREVVKGIESEEITYDDVISYLNDMATESELEKVDEEDVDSLLALYVELIKRTINDEGEEEEPSNPYLLGGENFCCAHELKYSATTKLYICEICGEEYQDA